MNTIFSKKLLAVVISSLLVGLTTSHDAFAQSSDVTDSVTKLSKQDTKEHKHSENERVHAKEHPEHSEYSERESLKGQEEDLDEHGHEKGHKEEKGDHDHGNENKEDEHEEGITLSPKNMSLANIKVESVIPEYQFSTIYAPGEIKANGYKSYVVSPRTESVIISRHAALGEHVEIGQKLVTLFSEAMALIAMVRSVTLASIISWTIYVVNFFQIISSNTFNFYIAYYSAYCRAFGFEFIKLLIDLIESLFIRTFIKTLV